MTNYNGCISPIFMQLARTDKSTMKRALAVVSLVKVQLHFVLLAFFRVMLSQPSGVQYLEKHVTIRRATGGIAAPAIVALADDIRNGWRKELPLAPDSFELIRPHCGHAKDLAGFIEENTFLEGEVVKNIQIWFSTKTSMLSQAQPIQLILKGN